MRIDSWNGRIDPHWKTKGRYGAETGNGEFTIIYEIGRYFVSRKGEEYDKDFESLDKAKTFVDRIINKVKIKNIA